MQESKLDFDVALSFLSLANGGLQSILSSARCPSSFVNLLFFLWMLHVANEDMFFNFCLMHCFISFSSTSSRLFFFSSHFSTLQLEK